jgi:hypothetical protein
MTQSDIQHSLAIPKKVVPWLLIQLGLPRNAVWAEAAPKVKARIIFARRNKRDDIAALWSEAKAMLRRRLPKRCNDCAKQIVPASFRCTSCASKTRIGIEKPYKPHASEFAVTSLVVRFAQSVNRPFFLPEVFYWVHQINPCIPRPKIARSVYDALRCMKRNGLVTGGGIETWKRYEPVMDKLSEL